MPDYQTRMSSRGQITVPADVREQLDLKPGDIVEFHIEPTDHSVRITAGDKSRSEPPESDLPHAEGPPLAGLEETAAEYLSGTDERISRDSRNRWTIGSAGRRSFFDGLDDLKLPSIGRPVTRADIDAAIDKEINARRRRTKERRK